MTWALPGAVVLAALSLVAAGCGAATTTAPPTVVAGENVWGDVAAQLGGDHFRVVSLISDPSADPHLYESDAAAAATVARARVVIENGAGYDDFLNRIVATGAAGDRTVVSVADVLHARTAGANPHFWYDLVRIPSVAAAIDAAMVHADPRNAGEYRRNLRRFDDSLQGVLAVVAEIRRRFSGAPVAYTERVPGYLLAEAGLVVETPPGFATAIEDGNEPGPSDTRVMEGLVTGHRIRVLLYNDQTTSPVSSRLLGLARRSGVPVVAVSEVLPPASQHFQGWQLAGATALLGALGAGT